jgi:hypothetical protein
MTGGHVVSAAVQEKQLEMSEVVMSLFGEAGSVENQELSEQAPSSSEYNAGKLQQDSRNVSLHRFGCSASDWMRQYSRRERNSFIMQVAQPCETESRIVLVVLPSTKPEYAGPVLLKTIDLSSEEQ